MPRDVIERDEWTTPVSVPMDGEPQASVSIAGGIPSADYPLADRTGIQALANRTYNINRRLSIVESGGTGARSIRTVADLLGLRLLTGMQNWEHCYVVGNGLYLYVYAATDGESEPYVIAPASLQGRWFLQAPRLVDTYLKADVDALLRGWLYPAGIGCAHIDASNGNIWAGSLYTDNIASRTYDRVTVHSHLTAWGMQASYDIQAGNRVYAPYVRIGGVELYDGGNNYLGVPNIWAGGYVTGNAGLSTGGDCSANWLRGNALAVAGCSIWGDASIDRITFSNLYLYGTLWAAAMDARGGTIYGGTIATSYVSAGVQMWTGGRTYSDAGYQMQYGIQINGDSKGFVTSGFGFWAPTQIMCGSYAAHMACGDAANPGGGLLNVYGVIYTRALYYMTMNGVPIDVIFQKLGIDPRDYAPQNPDDVPGYAEWQALLHAHGTDWKYDKALADRERAEAQAKIAQQQDAYRQMRDRQLNAPKAPATSPPTPPPSPSPTPPSSPVPQREGSR